MRKGGKCQMEGCKGGEGGIQGAHQMQCLESEKLNLRHAQHLSAESKRLIHIT